VYALAGKAPRQAIGSSSFTLGCSSTDTGSVLGWSVMAPIEHLCALGDQKLLYSRQATVATARPQREATTRTMDLAIECFEQAR